MNHTPGPWKVIPEYSQENVYRLWDTDGNYHDDTSPDTMDTNANLIAAAPELLRELKSAIFYIETYGGDVTASFSAGGNLDAVKAIIAKAEGKEG